LEAFDASNGWCSNFKQRYNLVQRVQTTARKLPENYKMIAINFVNECVNFIKEKGIKEENIINFDQIPRQFEKEPAKTIINKGTKEIFLRKATSSHHKYTFTPTISANGRIINQHLLFSKLKNPPTVKPGFDVETNSTGMWSQEILKNYLRRVILKRPLIWLEKEPVLVICESYGCHLAVVRN